jgi:hypothetical protein
MEKIKGSKADPCETPDLKNTMMKAFQKFVQR